MLAARRGIIALFAASLLAVSCAMSDGAHATRATPRSSATTGSAGLAAAAGRGTLISGVAVGDLHSLGGAVYVRTGNEILRFANGVRTVAARINWRADGSFAVDPQGNLYVSRYPYGLVKINRLGIVGWTKHVPKQVTGVFGHQGPHGFVIGAATVNGVTHLFHSSGSRAGSKRIAGQSFADSPTGDLVVGTGDYVVRYDRKLHRRFYFGAAGSANSPPRGQFAFYQQGSALELRNGDYLVADATRGIALVNPRGVLIGIAPESAVGALTQHPAMTIVGSRLYYATGPRFTSSQAVSYRPVADVVRAAEHGTREFGYGVGVVTPPGAYLAPGKRAAARLTINPWWRQVGGIRVSYRAASADDVMRGRGGPVHGARLHRRDFRHGLALRLPRPRPGPYRLTVTLRHGGKTLGRTAMDYSVGAPGDGLRLNRLPGSFTSGGPDGPRGVALAHLFGTGGHRIALSWDHLLTSRGTLTFRYYNHSIAAAERISRRTHTAFSVQLSDGGRSLPFINNGTWSTKVQQIVRHWHRVKYWEVYNEPNISFGPAASYVGRVLAPAYRGIKAANRHAQVLGGTVVGYDLGYWQQLAAAGGLRYMTMAAIHPYPGYGQSFEEEDFASYIRQLRALFARYHKPQLPIWVTELAWWSNGTVNVYGQADKSARALLWMKALHIPVWEYFLEQGSFKDNGQDYSAIEDASWVKPTALALMAARNQVGGRRVAGFAHTGIPGAYDLRFGSAGHRVQALWTDDEKVDAAVVANRSSTVRLVDQYGATRRIRLAAHRRHLVTLSGAVQYLHAPSGVSLSVRPAERWGADLALASRGAHATASSTNPASSPAGAIDGNSTSALGAGFPSGPAWISAPGDRHPSLTVSFPRAHRIDRVVVATTGIASVLSGLRSYLVQTRTGSGHWSTAARVRGNFYSRSLVSRFRPRRATAVRIVVQAVNYSGYTTGRRPSFWPRGAATRNPNAAWYGPAVVRELAVYAPG